MIRVFQMKAQPALYVVGSTTKPDKADFVFKGFLQGRIQQKEVAAGYIVFQSKSKGKLELVVTHDRAAADQLIIFMDLEPGAIDHGKILEQAPHPWVGC